MTTAGIATIPERANLLPRVVGSIIRGFNLLSDEDRRLYAPTKLYLSFSGYPDDLYDEVATRCNQETFNAKFQCNLVFYRHDTRVECGDQGKFMAAKEPQSMIEGHWSFDDDLEYRPEYFQNMVEGIKRHRWAIITYHGRSFDVNGMFEGYLQGPFLNRVRALDDHAADREGECLRL